MKPHEETWFVEDDGPEVEVHRVGGAVCGLNGPHARTPDDVARARLMAQAPAMARLLLKIEWKPLGTCPSCGALGRSIPPNPITGTVAATGHRPDCEFVTVLRAAGVLP